MRLRSFDVILMDVQMPDLDGRETTKEIHRLYAKKIRPQIIALTADASEGDRKKCLEAGMDSYISKPVRAAKIAETLREVHTIRTSERLA